MNEHTHQWWSPTDWITWEFCWQCKAQRLKPKPESERGKVAEELHFKYTRPPFPSGREVEQDAD